MFFKEHHPQVKVGLTDPKGANLHRYYRDGELKSEGNSITEGIGQGRITKNLEGFTPDYNLEIDDDAAMKACFELMTKEGLSLGLSSGINVAGAEALARQLGPGQSVHPDSAAQICPEPAAHILRRSRRFASSPSPPPLLTGKTLVTILCDSASRYAGKMFNRELLASKGLPTPDWIDPALPKDLEEALARAKAPDS
jgi:cysteine synthase A